MIAEIKEKGCSTPRMLQAWQNNRKKNQTEGERHSEITTSYCRMRLHYAQKATHGVFHPPLCSQLSEGNSVLGWLHAKPGVQLRRYLWLHETVGSSFSRGWCSDSFAHLFNVQKTMSNSDFGEVVDPVFWVCTLGWWDHRGCRHPVQ